NFAYEEDVLETLRDARRFLAPGGVVIPHSIVQWAAPVASDRFERDLRTWRNVGFGLDFRDAEHVTRNNMYVHDVTPEDLLPVPPASWDALEFASDASSRRSGRAEWPIGAASPVYGFALGWDCPLVPGAVLSTGPFAPPTHWERIYLPLLEPLAVRAGDTLALDVTSETGGGQSGIEVRWTATQTRAGEVVAEQSLDIGSGFLG